MARRCLGHSGALLLWLHEVVALSHEIVFARSLFILVNLVIVKALIFGLLRIGLRLVIFQSFVDDLNLLELSLKLRYLPRQGGLGLGKRLLLLFF